MVDRKCQVLCVLHASSALSDGYLSVYAGRGLNKLGGLLGIPGAEEPLCCFSPVFSF